MIINSNYDDYISYFVNNMINKRMHIHNPDYVSRKNLINKFIVKKPHENLINIDYLSNMMEGFSCFDIENIINESMLNVLRLNKFNLSVTDIENECYKIRENRNLIIPKYSNVTKFRICVHEIGHALMCFLLNGRGSLNKVCLTVYSPNIPGFTVYNRNYIGLSSYNDLKKDLVILLSGKNCEKIFFKEGSSTGCLDDINKAKQLANNILLEYSMGDTLYNPIGDDSKNKFSKDVEDLLNQADKYSLNTFNKSVRCINELANLLYSKQTILGDEFESIILNNYSYIFNTIDL